ncbi:MAG: hypothetical protein ABFE07_27720 [Armatimonadia bacterium]
MSFNFSLGNSGGVSAGTGGCAGCSTGCGAIFGLLFGLLLVPAGFYMVYYGEAKLVNHGVVFARTAMLPVEAAAKVKEGLVKFKGQPKGEFLRVPRYDKPVLYWDTDIEEYQEKRDSDGDRTHSWESVGGETKWAVFTIGPLKINPEKAKPIGQKMVFKGVKKRNAATFDPAVSDSSPAVGDRRLELRVIDANSPLIVLGDPDGQTCCGGSTFVVSALDEAGTEKALRTEYKVFYWMLKIGAGLAIWLGLIAIFAPLTGLLGGMPLVGGSLGAAFAFGAFVFSALMVAVATFALKFFWLVAILAALALVAVVAVGIGMSRKRAAAAPSAQIPTVLPPPPPAQ